MPDIDIIIPQDAATLAGLFRRRVKRSPAERAYMQFNHRSGEWESSTWQEMGEQVGRWQKAMLSEQLEPGDRIAILMANSREWVCCDQAALGLGLVTVPLYTNDHPQNIAYILHDAGVKLLLIDEAAKWQAVKDTQAALPELLKVVCLDSCEEPHGLLPNIQQLNHWLPETGVELQNRESGPHDLATIVYTSGTTGPSKGVMLSHQNLLFDAHSGMASIPVYPDDLFLSFLPLSHTLERTAGYLIPMMSGACVAFARSITDLADDLQTIQPTIMISVPRIFERVYMRLQEQLEKKPPMARRLFQMAVDIGWHRFQYLQHRTAWSFDLLLWPLLKTLVANKVMARLGGRLRLAISGGAPLTPDISHIFLGLGVPVVQGYGMTESSPVISVNKLDDNIPESVGTLLHGVEACTGDNGELLVRGPNVMMGYWNHPEATRDMIDKDGWLHTGDKARLDDYGHIEITGRIKEIIVMSNGEKLPPADMEMAILKDDWFEQVLILGEGRPYLSALVVLSHKGQKALAYKTLEHRNIMLLERIEKALVNFPGYAMVHRVHVCKEEWSVENDLQTPTLKIKRDKILQKYADKIEKMYQGH